MMKKLFDTNSSWHGLVIRLALGIVMFPHGMQKIFGWFGGYGFSGTYHYFVDIAHIPAFFAVLAILAESMGSLGLITGFLTRIAAFGIFCNMAVATLTVHIPYGFFMNWTGKQAGEGFEYHVLAMGLAVALMISGGGKWSIDKAIAGYWKEKKITSS